MVSFIRFTTLTVLASTAILLASTPSFIEAKPQDPAGGFSASGSGCDIILADPKYDRLLGCAESNVPQNTTSADTMTAALSTFCADAHKCNEIDTIQFLLGLVNSCGKDVITNPNNRAYTKFQALYTAVPRWESYCRKDKGGKFCFLNPDAQGAYSSRAHSFTCDECGQSRVNTYVKWEAHTLSQFGRVLPTIDSDQKAFNAKCPGLTVTDADKQAESNNKSDNDHDAGASYIPIATGLTVTLTVMVLAITTLFA